MIRLEVKPMSVNESYKGRRFKTNAFISYKAKIHYLLPKFETPKSKLSLKIVFGFSSKGSDIDNCVKGFMDCLQDKYKFNDNMVYKLDVEKVDVNKGSEFIEFELKEYEEAH